MQPKRGSSRSGSHDKQALAMARFDIGTHALDGLYLVVAFATAGNGSFTRNALGLTVPFRRLIILCSSS